MTESTKILDDQELIVFNEQGLIPGPDESVEDFIHRAHYCVNLRQELAGHFDSIIPLEKTCLAPLDLLQEALHVTKEKFGISPEWVPIIYSNHRLAPWHGGCACIFQLTENAPVAALFQLREAFASSQSYLGLYQRDELLAHESAHVGRMMFQEPKFEEFLAYRTAKTSFRRWFGPLIESAIEGALFVFFLFLIFLADFFFIFFGYDQMYLQAMWLKLIPIGMMVYGFGRLWSRHRQFSATLNKLTALLGNIFKANAVIYRLKDSEIIDFSKASLKEIDRYASEQAIDSLRWRIIKKAYFTK